MYSQDNNLIGLDAEVDGVWKPLEDHPSDRTHHRWVAEGLSLHPLHGISERPGKHRTEAGLLPFIPLADLNQILPGLRQKPHRP